MLEQVLLFYGLSLLILVFSPRGSYHTSSLLDCKQVHYCCKFSFFPFVLTQNYVAFFVFVIFPAPLQLPIFYFLFQDILFFFFQSLVLSSSFLLLSFVYHRLRNLFEIFPVLIKIRITIHIMCGRLMITNCIHDTSSSYIILDVHLIRDAKTLFWYLMSS